MTNHRTLDKDDLRSLLTALRDTSWSWQEADFPALAARLGWTDVEVLPGLGALVDPGHGLGADAFRLVLNRDGSTQRITMRLTSLVDKKDPGDQAFLAEAFTAALALATEVLGAPTTAPTRKAAEARWRGPEATLVLIKLAMSVSLTWATNEFQDTWDAATRK